LRLFKTAPTTENFVSFINQLTEFAVNGNRVQVIVDEVVEFSKAKFPIILPEDQIKSPFHWVVTGSAGIGTWVNDQHLGKRVFDLPLFSSEATMKFATTLCTHLKVDLCKTVGGIHDSGVSEFLEEKFGGVIGYVAEFCFAVKEQKDVMPYLLELNNRINTLLLKAAIEDAKLPKLSRVWLFEMSSPRYNWLYQRDAGLCG
jgi:hypothetical protein